MVRRVVVSRTMSAGIRPIGLRQIHACKVAKWGNDHVVDKQHSKSLLILLGKQCPWSTLDLWIRLHPSARVKRLNWRW